MRHPQPPAGPAGPTAAARPERSAFELVRGVVRGSPWLVIAASVHVAGIAALSLVYMHSAKVEAKEAGTSVRVVDQKPVEEAVEVKAETMVDRDSVPSRSEADAGVVNPDDVVIPDVEAGRPGEITCEVDPNREPGIFNPDPEAQHDRPSGATSGTSIGLGTIGHWGTGAPSAFLSRFAGGGGPGGGGLGQKGKRGGGGNPRTEKADVAVWAALKWLKNHQSPDGHWDSGGFDAQCKLNRCDGPGESTFNSGVSGLALLAYLGAGHTHQFGPFKETVKGGLKYLRDIQDSEGCFGPRTSQHFLYNHACASLALTEAYGMTGARVLKDSAQRGVGFVLKARNPYMAWRYDFPASGDNDTSITGWMVMALKSAKLADLEVETGGVKDAITWVDKMTEPEYGRTGYQQRGGPPARTNEAMAKFPASKSEALTAVGMTTRIFGGRDLKSDEMIGKGADLLAKRLPKWDVDQGTIDFYYWYYGSLAMFQVGGERWKKWNDAVKTALLDHQRLEKDRCEYGSWDPIDPWSAEGGRVYATAINCLTMEVYYRYPLLGVRAEGK